MCRKVRYMPPKPKFTREEIVKIAYELVRKNGESALTAREVGKSLGTSSSPIFTVFNDMSELRDEVFSRARAKFDEYMETADRYVPAYKMRGMQWVKFSVEEPMLFRMLFMQGGKGKTDFNKMIDLTPFGRKTDTEIIMRDYGATEEQAEQLFRQMWIYTYGLCAMCATTTCSFTEHETARNLGEAFGGMVYIVKSGKQIRTDIMPVPKNSEEGDEIKKLHPHLGQSSPDILRKTQAESDER